PSGTQTCVWANPRQQSTATSPPPTAGAVGVPPIKDGVLNFISDNACPSCPPGANCGWFRTPVGMISCGPPCPSGQACVRNVCTPVGGKSSCIPATGCPVGHCAASDGCGGVVSCGTCASGQTCGPSGVCTCAPLTACPDADNCGTIPDGCGG